MLPPYKKFKQQFTTYCVISCFARCGKESVGRVDMETSEERQNFFMPIAIEITERKLDGSTFVLPMNSDAVNDTSCRPS
jgi:hypothetical protein